MRIYDLKNQLEVSIEEKAKYVQQVVDFEYILIFNGNKSRDIISEEMMKAEELIGLKIKDVFIFHDSFYDGVAYIITNKYVFEVLPFGLDGNSFIRSKKEMTGIFLEKVKCDKISRPVYLSKYIGLVISRIIRAIRNNNGGIEIFFDGLNEKSLIIETWWELNNPVGLQRFLVLSEAIYHG